MTDPAFFDVVHAQRACREFAPTPVDDETIGRLLDAAIRAPSAGNKQPWEFVVVRDAGCAVATAATAARPVRHDTPRFASAEAEPASREVTAGCGERGHARVERAEEPGMGEAAPVRRTAGDEDDAGTEVVDAIVNTPTGANDRPAQDVVINSVTIDRR